MGRNLYKNWLLVSKIIWTIWITLDRQWKSKNMKFKRLYFSRKYIPSAKTYIENLSSITFNYCEASPSFLYHFWNQKSFFTTQLVSIFLTQTLHTFDRNILAKRKFSDFLLLALSFNETGLPFSVVRAHQKCKLSELPLLVLKFTKFVMSFLQPRICFSSNFVSLISVMRDHSSVLLHLKLYMLLKKGTHQSVNLQTFNPKTAMGSKWSFPLWFFQKCIF